MGHKYKNPYSARGARAVVSVVVLCCCAVVLYTKIAL